MIISKNELLKSAVNVSNLNGYIIYRGSVKKVNIEHNIKKGKEKNEKI